MSSTYIKTKLEDWIGHSKVERQVWSRNKTSRTRLADLKLKDELNLRGKVEG